MVRLFTFPLRAELHSMRQVPTRSCYTFMRNFRVDATNVWSLHRVGVTTRSRMPPSVASWMKPEPGLHGRHVFLVYTHGKMSLTA